MTNPDSLEQREKAITAALKSWHRTDSKGLLEDWLIVQQQQRDDLTSDNVDELRRLATNRALLEGLDEVEKREPHLAHTLRYRYLDQEVEQRAADLLNVSIPTMYRYRKHAVRMLTMALIEKETIARSRKIDQLLLQLPSPNYEQLFGVSHELKKLKAAVLKQGAPWRLLITGLGGIGKTSLIDAIVRSAIESLRYDHIIWIEIAHRALTEADNTVAGIHTQLTTALAGYITDGETPILPDQQITLWFKRNKALVVIDNVEDIVDATWLLQHVWPWTNPAKVIVTSRACPEAMQHVYVHSLDEIGETDALEFIRHFARSNNQQDLADATDVQLRPIIERTGGNPLAIKLVVGLAASKPLAVVLADLPQAHLVKTDEMYRHIYRRAWQSLSPDAQTLLKSMLLAGGKGVDPSFLLGATRFNETQMWAAITELVSRSLLLVRGTTFAPRYAIHRLTESFLQIEIVKWYR